jgi:hypothetical protein
MDVAELEEEDMVGDEDEGYLEEGRDGEEGYSEENLMTARRSLASIFGETEVLEVDEAQADESLLVRMLLRCWVVIPMLQAASSLQALVQLSQSVLTAWWDWLRRRR